MTKATLQFDLGELQDTRSLKVMLKSEDMLLALWTIRAKILRQIDHPSMDQTKDNRDTLEEMLDLVTTVLDKYDLDIDDLSAIPD